MMLTSNLTQQSGSEVTIRLYVQTGVHNINVDYNGKSCTPRVVREHATGSVRFRSGQCMSRAISLISLWRRRGRCPVIRYHSAANSTGDTL